MVNKMDVVMTSFNSFKRVQTVSEEDWELLKLKAKAKDKFIQELLAENETLKEKNKSLIDGQKSLQRQLDLKEKQLKHYRKVTNQYVKDKRE